MLIYNDQIIIDMYKEYDIPCDTLISNQPQLIAFAEDYNIRSGQKVELPQFAKHLLALRKRGEAKGGQDGARQ